MCLGVALCLCPPEMEALTPHLFLELLAQGRRAQPSALPPPFMGPLPAPRHLLLGPPRPPAGLPFPGAPLPDKAGTPEPWARPRVGIPHLYLFAKGNYL